MKKMVIRDAAGAVINIGPWDYRMEPIMADDLERPLMVDDTDKPVRDSEGKIVGFEQKVEGYEQKQVGERVTNPMPDGAYECKSEIVEGADEGLYSRENHGALRSLEYPSIGDQLDDLYKMGAFSPTMMARIAAVKANNPKVK